MKEKFLQYIWQQGLFERENITTQNGENVKIIHTGDFNCDAGPDFQNARIEIDDTIWAGNIEIHQNSSDWFKHNHQNDLNYDSIILHVVINNDAQIYRKSGQPIPTIELKYNKSLENEIDNIYNSSSKIKCKDKIAELNKFKISFWLNSLIVERLEQKTERILDELNQTNNNWEECFYRAIARNLGFKTNDMPFELLAKSLPLNILAKNRDNITKIEALLFGQAGMLSDISEHDNYTLRLQTEYLFLKNKYNLQPIDKNLWKNLRLRPSNFPTIRISQFAKLIFQSSGLFSKIMNNPTIDNINQLFDCTTSEYWETHYVFGKTSDRRIKHIGKTSCYLIYINTVIPFLFAYAIKKDLTDLKQSTIELLEKLEPESNHIIDEWTSAGYAPQNALTSQALLQVTKEYCDKKRCLQCQFGNEILRIKMKV